jgi:hypothetical protein
MVRSSVRPIVRSFVHSFVQIIFFLPLCCRNSDRSFVRSFDRSSFVHSSYSSFIVTIHRSSFVHTTIHHHHSSLLFIVTIHCHYSLTLFIIVTIHHHYCSYDTYNYFYVITIHCYYSLIIWSPQISTTHLSCCPVHQDQPDPYSSHTNSGDWDFPSSRELPIWSPIPDFSKLSTPNFGILSSQTSKKRRTMFVWIRLQSYKTWPKIPQPTWTRIPQHSSYLDPALVLSDVTQ